MWLIGLYKACLLLPYAVLIAPLPDCLKINVFAQINSMIESCRPSSSRIFTMSNVPGNKSNFKTALSLLKPGYQDENYMKDEVLHSSSGLIFCCCIVIHFCWKEISKTRRKKDFWNPNVTDVLYSNK